MSFEPFCASYLNYSAILLKSFFGTDSSIFSRGLVFANFRKSADFAYFVGINFHDFSQICRRFRELIPAKIDTRENLCTRKIIPLMYVRKINWPDMSLFVICVFEISEFCIEIYFLPKMHYMMILNDFLKNNFIWLGLNKFV